MSSHRSEPSSPASTSPSAAPARPGAPEIPATLGRHGWTAADEAAFAPRRQAGLSPARVVRRDRGRCELITEHGPRFAEIDRAIPADPVSSPCTGDWVAVGSATLLETATALGAAVPDAGIGPAGPMVMEVLPRRSALVRSTASRRSTGQVLAANVDLVLVVAALTEPLRPARLERLVALAWESGAIPLIVLTKADLAPAGHTTAGPDPFWHTALASLAPGVGVRTVSAQDGRGMDELRDELAGSSPGGRTTVLVGPSGVGKSTLANALAGADRLAVGAVRGSDGKGRHTTVRRELIPLPSGGVLIDTPGVRGIGLWGSGDGVDTAFAEIVDLAATCRFTDCEHRTEPGCAVLAAVEDGTLPERRLASYRKLQRESRWMRTREDARLAADQRAQWKRVHKEQRQLYADRERHGRHR
ncbi:ribosome small subunit-dependent GTPase A [Parafrankia colletiae]|uniref:Small ribosomal subunit biogenesis GTPase RsgA n=1 Tax=Parafrankia colletiae TaxID=573497 RepID=A0A1S1R2A4_9ACTN|nr:ribosome small subunit-dependent GTPase A [Parafrankia colletiae]MCK9898640.1 ribosome small subunit-dependent GTPase A [Frankia sp. Cpl3]OHV39432.1 ribosome small subunit-dependent GTPase A [Parafrankia colletiae]